MDTLVQRIKELELFDDKKKEWKCIADMTIEELAVELRRLVNANKNTTGLLCDDYFKSIVMNLGQAVQFELMEDDLSGEADR